MSSSSRLVRLLHSPRVPASCPRLRHSRTISSATTVPCVHTKLNKLTHVLASPHTPRQIPIKFFSASQTQTVAGEEEKHEFQAETRMLLDIVAKSLYSEKEVFIRELISNASDAIEKFRYLQMTGEALDSPDRSQEIKIATDKSSKTITIQDNGIGMTKEEMISNLGTIARSGSKAFINDLKEAGKTDVKDVIGQFGVGFYSAFMVADKIEVYSRSSSPGSAGYLWVSDGSGTYTIQECSNVEHGTKIIIHLKTDDNQYADESHVKDVVKKYSNFVGSDLRLNGEKTNQLKPVWLMDPKEVDSDLHEDFYRYVANAFDKPRFTLHYRTDAPMDIRALFYVPETKPGMFETNREAEAGVSLYCRKVLIKQKADNIIPKWLRFVKGVVDSEDIPLNLSRELLQDSALIRKLRTVITNRILRFLQERSRKETRSYLEFYKDYSFFLKEGIITSNEQYEKEEIAKLLRFESSTLPAGETVSLPEYCDRMRAGQREVYYLNAPSRQLAENSPYFEALKTKDVEVLFCYEAYDELVLMQLTEFDKKKLTSVEKEMRKEPEESKEDENALPQTDQNDLTDWIKFTLGPKAAKIKTTQRLESHPCVVTVEEMAAARHFIKTQGPSFSEEQRYQILQPTFEYNPSHPIVKKLSDLRKTNAPLAGLVAEQLFANAMVSAGLVDDPRTMLKSMNELLELALEKH